MRNWEVAKYWYFAAVFKYTEHGLFENEVWGPFLKFGPTMWDPYTRSIIQQINFSVFSQKKNKNCVLKACLAVARKVNFLNWLKSYASP